jgi:hypothetical protein
VTAGFAFLQQSKKHKKLKNMRPCAGNEFSSQACLFTYYKYISITQYFIIYYSAENPICSALLNVPHVD